MRRITWVIAIVMCVSVFLAGCGNKDANGVVKDLNHVVSKLDSYQGVGTMELRTGQQPQKYYVEVWYQNPHYYRISLTNEKKDITQIVLKNDEGVFVLTPHLKKSFRFQSSWPENQGQVYLYQTLVQSIVADKGRQFTVDDKKDAYVFDVLANYQNASLARQKIWIDQKNYAPKHVEISDPDSNVLVVVDFTHFKFGKDFDKDSFDMQRNMTSYNLSLPTLGVSEDAKGAVKDKNQNQQASTNLEDFGVLEPAYTPAGVKKQDISDVKVGGTQAVMLRYSGDYSYTILEARPQEKEAALTPGTLVDLGYTFGALTGDEKKTLTWISDGVEFRLSTGDLPMDEMVHIAQSVQGQVGK